MRANTGLRGGFYLAGPYLPSLTGAGRSGELCPGNFIDKGGRSCDNEREANEGAEVFF